MHHVSDHRAMKKNVHTYIQKKGGAMVSSVQGKERESVGLQPWKESTLFLHECVYLYIFNT